MKIQKFLTKKNASLLFAGVYSIAIVTFAVIFTGCGRNVGAENATKEEVTSVHVADIVEDDRPLPVRTSGRLATKAEIKLSFKIGGIIEGVQADEGDYVRKGALLARLNLAEIDAQLLQATSALDKARRDLGRIEGLYLDSVATLEQFQDAMTAVEIAEANVRIASFNRQHAEIKAPSSGRILKRTAERDELVAPGQPIFLFGAERNGWIVRVGLSDRDIVKVAVGDSARLFFDAYPDRVFSGWVTEIADAADPMTSTFEVEIAVDDIENKLKSGFIARVDLYPSSGASYKYIPVEALVEGNGREGLVYAYDSPTGEVKKVPIRIARILDAEIAVEDGLDAYTRVVTEGASFLKADGPVRVSDPGN